MFKLKIFLLLFYFFSITTLKSQTLVLQGQIDKSLKVDSLLFRYATNFVDQSNMFANGKDIWIKLENGKFSIELDSLPPIFYVLFQFPKKQSGTVSEDYRLVGNSSNCFRVKSDQQIGVKIDDFGITFSGPQTSSLDCQLELFRLRKDLSTRLINLANRKAVFNVDTNKEQVFSYLDDFRIFHNSLYLVAEQVLLKYSNTIEPLMRNTIYYDFLGNVKFDEINNLNWYIDSSADSVRSYYVAYYDLYYNGVIAKENLQKYQGSSIAYPKYLAYKAFSDISKSLAPLSRRMKPTVSLTDLLISERYKGDLYDQVAFSSLLLRATKEYLDDMFLVNLMANIQNPEFRHYIDGLRNRRSSRKQSFQFELEDQEGKKITNSNFKGKVVILDFWFTGCKGCLALHKNMAPVKEYFKDNSNFKYISISIDNKKESWLKSLKKGDYTDETDVKLWTGEKSSKHPIIDYYGISSYPTMILVNADDEVIAMNPPNPYSEKNKNTLIKMISEALNQ